MPTGASPEVALEEGEGGEDILLQDGEDPVEVDCEDGDYLLLAHGGYNLNYDPLPNIVMEFGSSKLE